MIPQHWPILGPIVTWGFNPVWSCRANAGKATQKGLTMKALTNDEMTTLVTTGGGKYRKMPLVISAAKMPSAFAVETLEGVMQGNPGDYLIRGIAGEFYPCDKAIFEASYEEVRP